MIPEQNTHTLRLHGVIAFLMFTCVVVAGLHTSNGSLEGDVFFFFSGQKFGVV